MNGFWLQVLFGGLTSGSIYALVAVGLALIYRATRVINFAHGEFVVIGALTAASLVDPIGLPLAAAAVLGVVAAGATGFLFERLVLRPMGDKPVFVLILCTLGCSIAFRGAEMLLWGKDPLRLPSFSSGTSWKIGGAAILPQALWVLGVTAVVMMIVGFVLQRTAYGKAVRACAENSTAASLAGIDVKSVIAWTHLASAALGGVAGVLISPIAAIDFQSGLLLAIKALTAAIIGGLDRMSGVVLGGLLLGVIEAFSTVFISSAMKDAFAFAILILLLMVRPQGLLGLRRTQ
ncbi:MAG TPA: branched-chain amino acid ABC transporter permease [Xanthobacteraceae bacterium]|jgi:branched-chain amino acid transport system permease protein